MIKKREINWLEDKEMQKLIKIMLILCLVCFSIFIVCPNKVAKADSIYKRGTCGDLSWTLDYDGLLYISGNGDYSYIDEDLVTRPDWCEYQYDIESVKVNVSNITNCSRMFMDWKMWRQLI